MPPKIACVDMDIWQRVIVQMTSPLDAGLLVTFNNEHVPIPRVLVERLVKRYYSCELMTQENGLWEDWDALRHIVNPSDTLLPTYAPMDGGSGEKPFSVNRLSVQWGREDYSPDAPVLDGIDPMYRLQERLAKIEERVDKFEAMLNTIDATMKPLVTELEGIIEQCKELR